MRGPPSAAYRRGTITRRNGGVTCRDGTQACQGVVQRNTEQGVTRVRVLDPYQYA
jgi:hypothetical protein